ncbi:hypothetical protein AAVH_13155 [Aphelenchoides avenae]|nr:hypothetical protein AAVH_13155 [Aphelenchus avenae]
MYHEMVVEDIVLDQGKTLIDASQNPLNLFRLAERPRRVRREARQLALSEGNPRGGDMAYAVRPALHALGEKVLLPRNFRPRPTMLALHASIEAGSEKEHDE